MKHKFLKSTKVGVSISDCEDLLVEGFGVMHLQDAMVEVARYLLASGAVICNGGDIKYEKPFNFLEILADITRNYNEGSYDTKHRIHNYMAFPIYTNLDTVTRAAFADVLTLHEVSPTETFDKITLQDTSPAANYIWARSLKIMREKMTIETRARIVLGGKISNYKGRYPGIAEEAWMSIKENKAVYLAGAFGGATRAVIEAIKGKQPEALSEDFQLEKSAAYKSFYVEYNTRHSNDPIDYKKMIAELKQCGVKGISDQNGLTEEENERLFITPNVQEMVLLILKGLKKIAADA